MWEGHVGISEDTSKMLGLETTKRGTVGQDAGDGKGDDKE